VNPVPLWRVFPWELAAAEGDRFSAAFVPGGQGGNRFDLAGQSAGVIYLAGSEVHAVAEVIQRFRNTPGPLTDDDLTSWGHRLALIEARLDPGVWTNVVDLCDPAALTDLRLTADEPPMRNRARTRAIALEVFGRGMSGLHWWSAFWGEWHTVVLFRQRITPESLAYAEPIPLDLSMPAVVDAARFLDIG